MLCVLQRSLRTVKKLGACTKTFYGDYYCCSFKETFEFIDREKNLSSKKNRQRDEKTCNTKRMLNVLQQSLHTLKKLGACTKTFYGDY